MAVESIDAGRQLGPRQPRLFDRVGIASSEDKSHAPLVMRQGSVLIVGRRAVRAFSGPYRPLILCMRRRVVDGGGVAIRLRYVLPACCVLKERTMARHAGLRRLSHWCPVSEIRGRPGDVPA